VSRHLVSVGLDACRANYFLELVWGEIGDANVVHFRDWEGGH